MRVAVSWSGGKDSLLALRRAVEAGHEPVALLHLTDEATRRDRASGVPVEVLRAQAAHLGVPMLDAATDWRGYEAGFLRLARESGAEALVFGDVSLADHRAWGERVARELGLAALYPLWGEAEEALSREVLARGVRALVVSARPEHAPALLGRFFDADLARDLRARGVSVVGERGEFHTLALDGPGFREPLRVFAEGEVALTGYVALDVSLPFC